MGYTYIERFAYNNGYRVLQDGSVISPKGEKLSGRINTHGYLAYGITRNRKLYAHRLQAYQKFGDKIYESGIEVRHLNGERTDNSYDNIEIGTHSDNMMDIHRDIRLANAIKASQAIVKWDTDEIVRLHNNGCSYREIMSITGITSKGTLSYIIKTRSQNPFKLKPLRTKEG